MSTIKGVILVGGPSRGTRFRPLSLKVPKPLFPVAGRPMIYHHCKGLAALKPKEILLIGFYEDSEFQQFVEQTQKELNVTIKYLKEYCSMGTGGGLYHFRDAILRGGTSTVVVINSDVCCPFPFHEGIAHHYEQVVPKGKVGTVFVTKVEKDVANRYGCVVKDEETDDILHFVEKPESFISDLVSCGAYIFQAALFEQIKQMSNSVDESVVFRLEQDILRNSAEKGGLVAFEFNDRFWAPIKTPGSAVQANTFYLGYYNDTDQKMITTSYKDVEIVGAVYIHPTAVIGAGSKIGPNVSVGPGASIGPGVRMKNAIILDNVQVKERACVMNAIIGWDSKLGEWSRVEGVLEPAPNTPITQNGVKMPSVAILGHDITVAPEVIVRSCIVLAHKDLHNSYHNEILL